VTTIAYRDGVLAGDSRVTNGDLICPETVTKVIKLPNGSLLGCAGTLRDVFELRNALVEKHPLPDLKKVTALLITPDEQLWSYDRTTWNEMDAPYYAIGSGEQFALAALWMGADAVQAVKCGIHFDKNSGGRVRTVRLIG